MDGSWHLAQINVGRLKAPIDAPETRDFADNLDRINALADCLPGHVWRLTDDDGATVNGIDDADPLFLANMSVWRSLDDLAAFVYRSEHRKIMRRRAEWFEPMDVYMTLWWVPAGHRPTVAEGLARLEVLARSGPTAEAFSFRHPFPAPDSVVDLQPILDRCA